MVSPPGVQAESACDTEKYAWESNKDGSVRLSYIKSKLSDTVELVYREKEQVLLARGYMKEMDVSGKSIMCMTLPMVH